MDAKLRLFGAAEVERAGSVSPIPADKRGCLLAYLAYHGDWVERHTTAVLFWPESDEGAARRNLRQLLARAKGFGESESLALERDRVRWTTDTDVAAFRRALGRREWEAAIAMYAGELAPGLERYGGEGFAAWLHLERESLEAAFRNAVLQFARDKTESGAADEALDVLARLVRHDPLAEDMLVAYLRAAYVGGQRDAALAAFERFEAELATELGLEPLPDTLSLVRQIRGATLVVPAGPLTRRKDVPLHLLRPPRLIGRERAVQAIHTSPARTVMVSGEAGVGKTRILAEVAPAAESLHGWEGLQSVPYHPVTAWLRRRLEQGDEFGELGRYRDDLIRLVPEIDPNEKPGLVEPQTAHARLLEALVRALERTAARPEPGFDLRVDDLQWIDAATLELLTLLVRRGNVRILMAYRSGALGSDPRRFLELLRTRDSVAEVRLEPLDAPAIGSLIADLAGQTVGPPVFSDWLYRLTGGNPMFALETLKSLFEAGALEATATGWRTAVDGVTLDYRELDVAPAVLETIRHQAGRLGSEAASLLQIAAVAHPAFAPQMAEDVTGWSEWQVLHALAEARAAGFLVGNDFRHDLQRQAVYRSASPELRSMLHAKVAAALEERADAVVVAEHWRRAGVAEREAAWVQRAVYEMRERGLHREAIQYLERRFSTLDPLRDPWPEPMLRRVESELARLYLETSRLDDAVRLAERQIAESQDAALRARAWLVKGAYLLYRESLVEEASEAVARAAQYADESCDASLIHAAWIDQTALLYFRGRYREGLARCTRELARLGPAAADAHALEVLNLTGSFHDALGEHEQALALHRRALEAAASLRARHLEVRVAVDVVVSCRELGRAEEAIPVAEAALELGEFLNSNWLRNNLASAYLKVGRLDEAHALSKILTERDDPNFVSLGHGRIAEIETRRGRVEPATSAAKHALAALESTRVVAVRALALASVLGCTDPVIRAEALRRARELDLTAVPSHAREAVLRALSWHAS